MNDSGFLSQVNRSVAFSFVKHNSSRKLGHLVLLHGLGADEHDLIGLAPYLDDRLEILSLRAPRNCQYGGYSWFDTSIADASLDIDCEHARESLDALCLYLAEFESPPMLAGFSQGAMMAMGVCIEQPELVSAAVCMSGALLPCFNMAGTSLPPILLTHGRFDPVVSLRYGSEAATALGEMGSDLTFREFPMGHEINGECLAVVSQWVSERLAGLIST